MPAIRVENLVKRYGDAIALDGLSFEVGYGELFGVLGPNGAGKTTLINVLSTLLRPTSGSAEVAGFNVLKNQDAVRRSIGVVFQDTSLDTHLTGRENLLFHAMMYGIPKPVRRQRLAEVLSLVELEDRLDALVGTYSGGMKRRLEIARGLLHHPRVLFLDEPTLGLDAQTRRRIWGYAQRLNRDEGVTIILTTHYMDEADTLCERVAIVDRGRLVALDTPSRLKCRLGGDVVVLETEGENAALAALLRAASWIMAVKQCETRLDLTMEHGDRRIPEIMAMAREAGTAVISVSLHKPSLEDVFLDSTGRSMRDAEGDGDARLLIALQSGVHR
jgi:ABC-2 type transport system ATP-binding protein